MSGSVRRTGLEFGENHLVPAEQANLQEGHHEEYVKYADLPPPDARVLRLTIVLIFLRGIVRREGR